jgi:phosphoribosyl 1,2-cyclic phosphodiesterase
MSKASLHALGTGDGWPGDRRGHSAFLFRLGGNTVLIDCGEPVSRRLRTAGVAPDTLDAIILSHLHCDHVGGFFMLMQGLWLDKRTRPLPIHLPAEGLEPVRNMLNAAYTPLAAKKPFNVGNIRITPFATTHLDRLREAFEEKYPAAFEAFSFLLETDEARVAHSADIGALTDLDPFLEKPMDLLVCELAHVEPDELFAYLADRPIGHVAFTHLSRPYRENLDELKTTAAKALGSMPHTFLMDGDMVEV